MPNLQEHMLRVTGVAFLICDNLEKSIARESVITACLIHDIGNIVKFKLEVFPEFLKPKGLRYWEKVQENFIRKHGKDDYQATYNILKEIGVDPRVFKIIKSMEFKRAPSNAKHKNFEMKICQYSDLRVTPFGITSLNKRLREVQNRFMRNKGIDEKEYSLLATSMRIIEKQIFDHCKIKPSDIKDENVNPFMEKLENFEIITNT